MKTIPLIYLTQFAKQADGDKRINAHRVGMYNMLPAFGPSVAGASLNLQNPDKATTDRAWRDWVTMVLARLGGAAAGAGLGYLGGTRLASPGSDAAWMSAVGGGLAGMAGGGYLGGRLAGKWRNEDKAKQDKNLRMNSTFMAMLDPYTASSLMRKNPGDIALRGTAGLLAGGLVPLAGPAITHALLHDKSEHRKQAGEKLTPQIGFLDALKVLKAQATGEQPNEAQLRQLMESRMWSNLGSSVGRGTAIGALGGVGVQALRRADEPDPKKKPSLLNGLLMGGLLGAGAGGAVGIPYAADGMRQVYNETPIGKVRPMSVTELLGAMMGRAPAPQQ